MDDRRFDTFAQRLAAHDRRRFGTMAVAFGLGVVLSGRADVARAKRKKRRNRRKRRSRRCGGGPCDRCGIAGNPCCSTGGGADDPGTCEANLFCTTAGACAPCGGAVGQPCCPPAGSSDSCDAAERLVCSFRDGDTCVACGGNGEPCCADAINGGCDPGLVCTSTIPPSGRLFCFPCGGAGQRCCGNGLCGSGLACGVSGTCGACPGGADEC